MSARDMALASVTSVIWGLAFVAVIAPCTGLLSSALIFREVFSPMRYAGMALILGGLAVIVLPAGGSVRAKRP